MNTNINHIVKEGKSYLTILLAMSFYAIGWCVFILPNNLVGGGATGFAAIINYCTGFDVSYTFLLTNIVLLLLGFKVLGKGFGAKTIVAIIACTVFLKLAPMVIPQSFIDTIAIPNGKLLCTIVGGTLSGIGIGISFAQGGSSGGTDIIALIVTKYRNVTPGKVLLVVDVIIIASSLLIPGESDWGVKIATIIYGFILEAVSTTTIDLVLSGSKQSVQIFIFSHKYKEIADRITSEVHRGVTAMDGEGWYTKQQAHLLLTIVRKSELSSVLKITKEEDPDAFLSIGNVNGVFGRGFDLIKK